MRYQHINLFTHMKGSQKVNCSVEKIFNFLFTDHMLYSYMGDAATKPPAKRAQK